jgi:hypothetical protein
MIAYRDPGDPRRINQPESPDLVDEVGRFFEERQARTAHDTVADDCAEGFLGELDEILWLLQEIQQAEENAFEHATRKADHIEDLRRLLYRLHVVLTAWEVAATG